MKPGQSITAESTNAIN